MKSIRKFEASRREALLGVAACSTALWIGQAHQVMAQSPTGAYEVEAFFNQSGTKGAALSPSGEKFARLVQSRRGDNVHSQLFIHTAQEPDGAGQMLDLGDLAVRWVRWSDDDRLLVKIVFPAKKSVQRQTGSNRRVEVEGFAAERVACVDTKDGKLVVMFENEVNRMRYSPYLGDVADFLNHDPDHILMPAWDEDGSRGLYKLNITTGRSQRVDSGNTLTIGWIMHEGVPVLRRDINPRGNVISWMARLPGETQWRLARRTQVRDTRDFDYVGPAESAEKVRVVIRAAGENHMTLRDMSLRDFSLSAPLHHRDGMDARDGLYDRRGKWMAAEYYGERLEYDFADPQLAAHHRALNQFFDNDCDVHLTDISADSNRMIAFVNGPREPGTWIYYDRGTRNILPLGNATTLDFERLGVGKRVEVTTRDGAKIEAYLTAPPSGLPGPLVVLPHGGPEVRDYRTYDRQSQILATQGWWVLQPNFRGSGGYGQAFAEAGWKRWGDRMQEDVEDAVAQVIAENGLDAARVAIMGTSYGGYAALMGAVRQPQLYKAAISICGVADLVDMLQWEKRTDDTAGNMIFEFWTKRIGSLDTDMPMIEAASPRKRVAEIVCPILLVHGTKDRIVPHTQSMSMHRTLRSAGKEVQYIEVDAGHGDWDDDKEMELMKTYITLLRRVFA